MPDSALGWLANKLANVVEENASLILGIKEQVEDLARDLKSFQAILKQASKHESSNENSVLKDVVDKVRTVVRDAEDAIDNYLVYTKMHESKGAMKRYLDKVGYCYDVNHAAKEIKAVQEKVRKIRSDNQYSLKTLQQHPNTPHLPRQTKVSQLLLIIALITTRLN